MDDNNNTNVQAEEITLTLTPDEVMEEVNETLENAEAPAEEEKKEARTDDPLDSIEFTEAEKKTISDFSKQIDITKSNTVLQYGAAAQKKVSDFSDNALKNVRTKDLDEVGDLLSDLVVELKSVNDEDEKKGILGLFKKGKASAEKMKANYDKVETNVDKVVKMLEDHQITLLKDIATLDQLYEKNQTNSKELAMYILAGRQKLQDVRENELAELIETANRTGLAEDAQKVNDLEQACTRFEKKLYDLELTRTVSQQMAPQIRLVQNNDTLMTEKIQSTLVNTIPLWKNQIVLSLGLAHSEQAMQAEREVNNMTNDLLKKNAEMLHSSTVEVAKEAERGIVDIETLKHTNEELIATLDEVLTIQQEGREKRKEAEIELRAIENELTDKLMEIRK